MNEPVPLLRGQDQASRSEVARKLPGGFAPITSEVTAGRPGSQASATWAGETPRSSPMLTSTSTVAYKASRSRTGGSPQSVSCRDTPPALPTAGTRQHRREPAKAGSRNSKVPGDALGSSPSLDRVK